MTQSGWHAKEFARFGAQPRQAGQKTGTASGKPKPQNNIPQPPAGWLRQKFRQSAKNRQPQPVNPHPDWSTKLAQATGQPRPQPERPEGLFKGRPLLRAVMVPTFVFGMIGLFVVGYQGGQIFANYLRSIGDEPVATAQPALPPADPVTPPAEIATSAIPKAPTPVEQPPAPTAEEKLVEADAGTSETTTALLAPSNTDPAPAAVEPAEEAAAPAAAPAAPETPLAQATRLVGEGHSLLAKGDVLGARDLFNQGLKLGLPEAALALGRSYDPEYLAALTDRNAEPDVSMASLMYRDWYNRSVEAGTISEAVQFEKLIQSMRN